MTYFFLMGVISLGEYTVLKPVTLLLGMICTCIYPIAKGLLCYWMWNTEYRGALLIEKFASKYVKQYYSMVAGPAGKYLAYVGIPNRELVEKKQE